MRFGIFRSHARRFSGFAKRSLRIGFAEEGIRQIDVRLRKIRLESHGGLKLANGRIDLLLREKYPSEGIVPFRTVRGHSPDVFECRLRRCQIPFLQRRNALLLFSLLLAVGSPANQNSKGSNPIAYFNDKAKEAGLTMMNVFGGENTKKYITETPGTGVAIFDYDNDGWPDIFIVNSTKLDGFPPGKAPTNHLYHNNHDGTFTDVTEKAGVG